MGWFGKKNSEIESDYVDVESMPIAVAVMDSPMAAPSAPPSSQDASTNVTPYTAMPQQHQQKQVVAHQQQKQHQPQQQPVQHVFLSRIPTMLNPCPFCSQSARTRVRTAPNWATWISAIILLFIFWPICWIPFVADSMKQTDHFCTSCHQKVGTVGPFKDCCVKNRY